MRWLAVVLTLVLAAPAGAATVTGQGTRTYVDQPPKAGGPYLADYGSLTFTAGAGEVNQVTVSFDTGTRTATITDSGTPLTPGPGCTAVTPNQVTCDTLAGIENPTIPISRPTQSYDLGDGDDSFVSAPGEVTDPEKVIAGDGNDTIISDQSVEGGAGDDALTAPDATGGPGNDTLTALNRGGTLTGGDGADTLIGSVGDDTLEGGPGSDAIDGGGGQDTVRFFGPDAVVVDLADPAPDGPAAEPDTLTGIENVVGSSADDTLRGDDGVNRLSGGPGEDTVDGGGGNDELTGGLGADRIDGGDGNDTLTDHSDATDILRGNDGDDELLARGGPDDAQGNDGDDVVRVKGAGAGLSGGAGDDELRASPKAGFIGCGSGRDSVMSLGTDRVIPEECELVLLGLFLDPAAAQVVRGDGTLAVSVPHLCGVEGERCRTRVTVADGDRVVARGRIVAHRPKLLTLEGALPARRTSVVVRFFAAEPYGSGYSGAARLRVVGARAAAS